MTQLDFFLSVLFLSIVSVNNGFQLIPYSCNPVNIWSLLDLKPLSWLAKTFICFTPTFSWTLSVLEKLKNSIFEISIIPQTLNITNYRTPSAKPINLDIIRKLIEFSLKSNCVNAIFSLTVFGILLFKGRSVLWSVQLVTGCKRV